MEDKRIIRTKHNLKDAMIRMLSIEDFEHISVTELCKEAKVSRITFYSHYSDKQSLLDDIFNDMRSIGREDYYRRQKENNPEGASCTRVCKYAECDFGSLLCPV